MTRFNPLCDRDLRNGLQFLAGINLLMNGMSILIDVLAIAEISHFYNYWQQEKMLLSVSTSDLLLTLDILCISFQIFHGLKLHTAVFDNDYTKIRRWILPGIILIALRVLAFISYLTTMPASPFYYYFTTIAIIYSIFLFWPVNRFLSDCSSSNPYYTENSRLIGCVNVN